MKHTLVRNGFDCGFILINKESSTAYWSSSRIKESDPTITAHLVDGVTVLRWHEGEEPSLPEGLTFVSSPDFSQLTGVSFSIS